VKISQRSSGRWSDGYSALKTRVAIPGNFFISDQTPDEGRRLSAWKLLTATRRRVDTLLERVIALAAM
jgi:hypothetical protein